MAPVHNSSRDLRLDSLRGLFLVTMTVNHLPSLLHPLTDQPFGIFSSAEGFIFISGLLAGLVYTRRLRAGGPAALLQTARGRATTIYRWHLAAFLGGFAAVRLTCLLFGFCSQSSPQLFFKNPLLALLLGATMLHQPGLFDVLPMYCAFVLALPFVLGQLERGRRAWVIGLSGALWLAVQGAPPIDKAPLFPIHVGSFNLFAWQFLFIMGVVIGHARATPHEGRLTLRPWLAALAGAAALYGWGVCHLYWRPPWSDSLFGVMVNKPALGCMRLADFAAVAYLAALAASRFPALFTWRPFAFLGRHSIAIFAAQSVVAVTLLEFPVLFATPSANLLTSAAAIGALFAVAGAREAARRLSTSRKPAYGRLAEAGQPA